MSDGCAINEDAVWKALADPTRRRIIELLDGAPRTTGELSARFPNLTRYAVMKHIGVLEHAGLVYINREGRMRWNIYNHSPVDAVILPWVIRHVAGVKERFGRLKECAEGDERVA